VNDVLAQRRSVSKVRSDPVDPRAIERLITAATWAPNHHLTEPWRFVVMVGAARNALGEAHARAVGRLRPGHPSEGLSKEALRPLRAPVVIAIVHVAGSIDPVVLREDRDAVAAATQNLLLAAHSEGLGAMWRTGAMVDEDEVRDHLGLAPGDSIVGFVYVGWPESSGPSSPSRRPITEIIEWRDGQS
jgi:nitroreductase